MAKNASVGEVWFRSLQVMEELVAYQAHGLVVYLAEPNKLEEASKLKDLRQWRIREASTRGKPGVALDGNIGAYLEELRKLTGDSSWESLLEGALSLFSMLATHQRQNNEIYVANAEITEVRKLAPVWAWKLPSQ